MSPRPDVSEERKQQILTAAQAVFARLGFQQSRMDDIAQEAGLSKGAVYLYYKSKDAIIASVLQSLFTQEYQRLATFATTEQEQSVRTRLLILTDQLITALQWIAHTMPVTFEFYAIAGRQPEVRTFLQQYFQQYRSALAELIQQGIDRHEFRSVDAGVAAMTLVAFYEGLALLFFLDQDALRWEEQARQSLELLLDGLKPELG